MDPHNCLGDVAAILSVSPLNVNDLFILPACSARGFSEMNL